MIRRLFLINLLSLVLFSSVGLTVRAQNSQAQNRTQTGPATLGLEAGYLEFDTPDFNLKLVKTSQTIAALEPKNAKGFDFTPADRLVSRARDGFYHLGDLILRLRKDRAGQWQNYSTAAARQPVFEDRRRGVVRPRHP